MFADWPDFPAIKTEHLWDARLYADRHDLIRALPIPRNGAIAEIGVWRGSLSKILVTELKPQKFVAFDIFTGHTEKNWNGMTGHQLFDGLTHRQFYERQMKPFLDITTIVEGPSKLTLRDYADQSFDFVYVDAAHHIDAVKADTELASRMVADSGFLVFDDYSLIDPSSREPMGVVPVVNDLVVNHGWCIVGFALNRELYCNIALCRLAQALQACTAMKDRQVAEIERYAKERDRYAEERDRYAEERDRCTRERDRSEEEKDQVRRERDIIRQELHKIVVSKSWRWTRPLRAVRSWASGFGQSN